MTKMETAAMDDIAVSHARALKKYCREHAGCDESGCVFADYDDEGFITCNISVFNDDEGDVVMPSDWDV